MKITTSIIAFIILALFTSCEKESQDYNYYNVAVPIVESKADFRTSVSIEEPKEIEESGKIYAYGQYVFVNDKYKGVHVIDNRDPNVPKKIKYLKIPRNIDIAIKDDMLYADSGMDLVVFDISSIDNIKEAGRLEDVFPTYNYVVPAGASYVDSEDVNFEEEVIVGYVMERRKIEMAVEPMWEDALTSRNFSSASGGTGTGGSMARFNIAEDYLYVVDRSNLSVFNIENLSSPQQVNSDYVGWEIETIFNQDEYLYLGSSTGMYIYSIEDPAAPQFKSVLEHVRGCDPVVVQGDIAYVTIRGGNICGQSWSQLDVIDVSNKENPQLLKTYEMESPYGLGVKDDWLFICDGDAGLKVYDTKETPELSLVDRFEDINAFDVIPLENVLLMIGDNQLLQYTYKNDEINLLSSLSLE